MKGMSKFSAGEASRIRSLLFATRRAPRDEQKRLRDELRTLGFYITDFSRSSIGFRVEGFDDLVASGRAHIEAT